jgi:predicted membrane protein
MNKLVKKIIKNFLLYILYTILLVILLLTYISLFTEKPTGHVDERLMILAVVFLLIECNFVGIIYSIFKHKKIKLTIISYLLFIVNTFLNIFIFFSFPLGNIFSFLIVFAIEKICLKIGNKKITMNDKDNDSFLDKKTKEDIIEKNNFIKNQEDQENNDIKRGW